MCCKDIGKQILAVFALLAAPGIFDHGVAALWCRVGEGSWPWLCKPCSDVPRSSEIQDLHPRLLPEGVTPQYHPKDTGFFPPALSSSLVSGFLGGLAANLAVFWDQSALSRGGILGSASACEHQSGVAYPSNRRGWFIQALSKQLAPYQHFPPRWGRLSGKRRFGKSVVFWEKGGWNAGTASSRFFLQKSAAGFTGRREQASSQVVALGISLNSLEPRDL